MLPKTKEDLKNLISRSLTRTKIIFCERTTSLDQLTKKGRKSALLTLSRLSQGNRVKGTKTTENKKNKMKNNRSSQLKLSYLLIIYTPSKL